MWLFWVKGKSWCLSSGMCMRWIRTGLKSTEHHRLMESNCICLRVKNLLLWAIHYFKLFSINPTAKIHPQKHTVGIYYLDLRAPSCLSGVFISFGVPQQSNSYSNSPVLTRWDLLWRPNSSTSILNERQPVPIFSCGLSAVCPLVEGRRESTQQPLSPPEGQLHRTGSHGELLMIHMMAWASHCLGYITQRGTNNRSQCHLIMAQKANLTDLHSSQG